MDKLTKTQINQIARIMSYQVLNMFGVDAIGDIISIEDSGNIISKAQEHGEKILHVKDYEFSGICDTTSLIKAILNKN